MCIYIAYIYQIYVSIYIHAPGLLARSAGSPYVCMYVCMYVCICIYILHIYIKYMLAYIYVYMYIYI